MNLKKLLLIGLIGGLCAGCTVFGNSEDVYAPPGQPEVEIGTVPVYRLLKYADKLVEDRLAVKRDGNGHTVLVAGEGEIDEVAVYLKESIRDRLADDLKTVNDIASGKVKNEKKQFFNKTIVIEDIDTIPNSIWMSYSPNNYQTQSVLFMKLSGFDIETTTTVQVSRPPGMSDLSMVLTAPAISELLRLIEQAGNVSGPQDVAAPN